MTSSDPWNEDLAWHAQRGLELARALCTCAGRYHWSYGVLRAAGVVSSLSSEEPAWASLMTPLIGDRARVMIGGAADVGLLCIVGRCAAARRPQITLIDKCRAPLALIEEFTAARGLACRTLQADLLAFDGHGQWDNILLHYTPEFLDTASRAQFFKAVAASLVPGGTLVCVSMTGHKFPHEKKRDLASAFRTYSLSALRQSPLAAYAQDPEFGRMLDDYAEACAARRLNYPDAKELHDVLGRAGLRIVSEHVTPRRWRFFKIDPVAEFDRSSTIIATRD